jgi:hypothetical protein
MIDNNLVEALRAKYQYEMKLSVSRIAKILEGKSLGDVDDVDLLLDQFKNAKDKAGYFEGILKTIKTEENE